MAALEKAGVEVAFGLPGVHNLALWRALGGSPIRLVGVRHEQTAAYAADGYARASGRLGVALTTTGPGAANTLAAVGEAWASRQPVLVIATDIPTKLRRPGVWRGVLHEATDQAAMFAPVVKETDPRARGGRVGRRGGARRRDALAAPRAARVRRDPDRPAVRRVDEAAELDLAPRAGARRPTRTSSTAPLELLERSRRPLIWAGGGALQSGAGEAVARSPSGWWRR